MKLECKDRYKKCFRWTRKPGFKSFCNGWKKDKRLFGVGKYKWGSNTMMEVCRKSCGGCKPGNVSVLCIQLDIFYKLTPIHFIIYLSLFSS